MREFGEEFGGGAAAAESEGGSQGHRAPAQVLVIARGGIDLSQHSGSRGKQIVAVFDGVACEFEADVEHLVGVLLGFDRLNYCGSGFEALDCGIG